MEKKNEIGVIVGRFQTPTLTDAHMELIRHVANEHDRVLLFIGTTEAMATRRNPLDYVTREVMIREKCDRLESTFTILPLKDQSLDESWSNSLDDKMKEVYPTGNFILYGARDSFIPYYTGKYKAVELELSFPELSATSQREKVSKLTRNSSDFRSGVIYGVYNNFPITHPVVDVAIVDQNTNQILLGRKKNESKYRLIGGFVDPTDQTLELAAKREVVEETGLEVGNFRYVTSMKVNDWRYEKCEDRSVMTSFFVADYIFGSPKASDDIEEVKWFDLKTIDEVEILDGHKELIKKIK